MTATLWAVEARDVRRAAWRHIDAHPTRSLARAHAERIRTPGLLDARVVAYRRQGRPVSVEWRIERQGPSGQWQMLYRPYRTRAAARLAWLVMYRMPGLLYRLRKHEEPA